MVTETFRSVQGESTFAGRPFFFIRLTGCNLRCGYCDTRYAYEGGEPTEVSALLEKAEQAGLDHVLITGGEPLMQSGTPVLAEALLKAGYTVLVETNGTKDISVLPKGVIRIMDLKCPSSGHEKDILWANLDALDKQDEIKLVIANEDDYQWAVQTLNTHRLFKKCTVLFSPVFSEMSPETLAEKIVQDRLPVRLNLQLHKLIWPDKSKGV